MKKTLMIAATALALTTGAAALNTSPAQAGVSFNVHVGGYGHGFYDAHYDGGCYYKWKRVKIRYPHYHGYYKHWHWKWISKRVQYCY